MWAVLLFGTMVRVARDNGRANSKEKKTHQTGRFCHSVAVEPGCGESRFWGDLARSKKVQDKERGSQAPPPAQVTPSRNAGRGNGLRDLERGPHRWSVWNKADVIGGRILEKRASNPCGWAVPQEDARGAPWGSWEKFEKSVASPDEVWYLLVLRK